MGLLLFEWIRLCWLVLPFHLWVHWLIIQTHLLMILTMFLCILDDAWVVNTSGMYLFLHHGSVVFVRWFVLFFEGECFVGGYAPLSLLPYISWSALCCHYSLSYFFFVFSTLGVRIFGMALSIMTCCFWFWSCSFRQFLHPWMWFRGWLLILWWLGCCIESNSSWLCWNGL